jgi:uncharacterized protein YggE
VKYRDKKSAYIQLIGTSKMPLVLFSNRLVGLTTAFLCCLPISPAMANELQKVLIVTGEGTETIATTLTEAQLTVEIKAETAAQVQTAIAAQSNRLVAFLQSQRVDKLETQGLQLRPNYVYRNNESTIEGYIGTNTVSFQYPSDKIGKVLDQAVSAGASRIDGIRFLATPQTLELARQQALTAATADAQSQARTVLSSLNLAPKEIVQITIDSQPTFQPGPMRAYAHAAPVAGSAPTPTPIMGAEQTVTARVTLEIAY